MHTPAVWRIILLMLLASIGFLSGRAATAERTYPIRIGALTAAWGPTPQIIGLRDGLVALGYREHEQFAIGVRFTQGEPAALPAAARDLVQDGVDLLFVGGDNDAAHAAQQATTSIPIVFAGVSNPLGSGLIQSFAQPGRNITGVTDLDLELAPKRLHVFQEMLPSLKRLLFLYDATHPYSVAEARAYRDAARRLGVALVEHPVRTQKEVQAVLAQVRQGEGDGVLAPGSMALNIPGFILEAAAQRILPTMFHAAFWVERGALASYGPDYYDSGRQAARLVDKILRGAKPAEIPVEGNAKIEFVINRKTAHAWGLTIAPEALFQANRLIR
jgi:putative ABC transport system substrate-binding protein